MKLKRLLRALVGTLLIGLIALALVRVVCLRVFTVVTGSMEPTIHGAVDEGDGFPGERVLVAFGPLFDPDELERFDLVVFQREGQGAPLCKRLIGLPGDRLQLVGGDLLVNGAVLPAGVPRPAWIDVFDQARDAVEEHFHYARTGDSPWQVGAEVLSLSAEDIARGAERGMMLFQRELTDTVRLGDGALDAGVLQVNDARLELEFFVEPDAYERGGQLRFRLVEGGDRFEAVLEFGADGAELSLERQPGGEVLARVPIANAAGRWWRLGFENRDDHLALELADVRGEGVPLTVTATYAGNRPFQGLLPDGLSSIAPRVAFGGTGVRARFRGVRVFRDLYWTATGDWGGRPQIELGPGEYFAVGDNSANSLDSRHWGPLREEELIGRPIWIVGPADSRRPLE